MPQKKKKNTSKRGEGKLPTTRRVSTATNSGSSSSSSGTPGQGLVSNAERAGFVEAVVAGKLKPNLTAVAYHFEGWLDRGAIRTCVHAPCRWDSPRLYVSNHARVGTVPVYCYSGIDSRGWYSTNLCVGVGLCVCVLLLFDMDTN